MSSNLILPPNDFVRKWNFKQDNVFKAFDTGPTTAHIMEKNDFDGPLVWGTDAHQYAVTTVFSQIRNDGSEHLVYYHAGELTPAGKNSPVRKKECLRIVLGVSKLRTYIFRNCTAS